MYSVVVVGAGPAGSTAARFLSEKGYNVLLIDRKTVVGVPKQCAEGLFGVCFPEFSVGPGDFIAGEARYMAVVFPNGKRYRIRADIFMLDRPAFDQHLLKSAEESGADLMLGKRVQHVDSGSGIVHLNGETVQGEVVVGADGPMSAVARSMGIKNRLVPAVQFEMRWQKDDAIYAYLDRELSPYSCWIFPKNRRGTANVGCFGTLKNLRKFVSKLDISSEVLEVNRGVIPLGRAPLLQQKRSLLIGDAAGLTNPFTGGGLYPAARSARLAAESIDHFLNGDKLDYESLIRRDIISSDLHMKARNLLAGLSNDELNDLGDLMDGVEFPGVRLSSWPVLLPRIIRHRRVARMKYWPILLALLKYCRANKVW